MLLNIVSLLRVARGGPGDWWGAWDDLVGKISLLFVDEETGETINTLQIDVIKDNVESWVAEIGDRKYRKLFLMPSCAYTKGRNVC